jgi:SAM-dependent methyltransferase
MKDRKETIASKEAGLEVALLLLRFFVKSDYLHYGYWEDGVEVDVSNLKLAQDRYAEFLFSHIPAGVRTILDVGCGTGRLARVLVDRGYKVDCVSPAQRLTQRARAKLGNDGAVFEGFYETATIPEGTRYDLILFSESFQYIALDRCFERSDELLNDGGHMLICDFFRYEEHKHRPLGGGQFLGHYEKALARSRFRPVKEIDITRRTAPTMDVANALSMQVLRPAWHMLLELAEGRLPSFIWRAIRWKFRKKLDRIENRQFSGERNAASFIADKKYCLLILERR